MNDDDEPAANDKARPSDPWDAGLYQDRHSFVWKYGADLIELLAPAPGERILDLGCGTGQLADAIANRGAEVVGIDRSADMVEQARRNYPRLRFDVANATAFEVDAPFDAVFSNAVLHWVKLPAEAVARVWRALRPGGRFVAEFGGKRNIAAVASAMAATLAAWGGPPFESVSPWYYPSIGEYATLLERQGFDVTTALLFDRPTQLEEGEGAMADWVRMFGPAILAAVPQERRDQFVGDVVQRLRPTLWRDGRWWVDYRRIRVVARRPEGQARPEGQGG